MDNWISVKDKLPERATKVIVIHLTSNGRDEAMGQYLKDIKGWHYFGYWTKDYSIEVTHWMPLPKPPKDNG